MIWYLAFSGNKRYTEEQLKTALSDYLRPNNIAALIEKSKENVGQWVYKYPYKNVRIMAERIS